MRRAYQDSRETFLPSKKQTLQTKQFLLPCPGGGHDQKAVLAVSSLHRYSVTEPQQQLLDTSLDTVLLDLTTEEIQQLAEMLEKEEDNSSRVCQLSLTPDKPTLAPPSRRISTINHQTESISRLINQYVNQQKQTGMCGS